MNHPTRITLHTGRFLALVEEGHWEYADRTNGTGASTLLAVTDEQKLLLEKAMLGVRVGPNIYAGLYFIGRLLPSM